MKRKEPFEFIPKKEPVECKCICPTCRDRFTVTSCKLYPNRLNWKYCSNHEKNRHREENGWKLQDVVDKNNIAEVSETDLIVITQEKINIQKEMINEVGENESRI